MRGAKLRGGGLKAVVGVMTGTGWFWEVTPEVFEVGAELVESHGLGDLSCSRKAEFKGVS